MTYLEQEMANNFLKDHPLADFVVGEVGDRVRIMSAKKLKFMYSCGCTRVCRVVCAFRTGVKGFSGSCKDCGQTRKSESRLFSDHPMSSRVVGEIPKSIGQGSRKKLDFLHDCGHSWPVRIRTVAIGRTNLGECRQCKDNALADRNACLDAGYKVCSSCQECKETSEFARDKKNWTGLQTRCKYCKNAGGNFRGIASGARKTALAMKLGIVLANKERREKDRKDAEILLENGYKECSDCKKTLGSDSFHKSAFIVGSSNCIDCKRAARERKLGRRTKRVARRGEGLTSSQIETRRRMGMTQAEATRVLSGYDTGFTKEPWMNEGNRYGNGRYCPDTTWQVDHVYPVASYVRAVEAGVCSAEDALIHCEHISNKRAVRSGYNQKKSDNFDGLRLSEPFPDPRGRFILGQEKPTLTR
ncbi:MAG: hypothetical protein ACR2NF_00770 [Pirellulales bacterium]